MWEELVVSSVGDPAIAGGIDDNFAKRINKNERFAFENCSYLGKDPASPTPADRIGDCDQ